MSLIDTSSKYKVLHVAATFDLFLGVQLCDNSNEYTHSTMGCTLLCRILMNAILGAVANQSEDILLPKGCSKFSDNK